MNNPTSLKYADTHEWVRLEQTGEITVGITDHAQDLLGDMVFAELPEVGQRFTAKEQCMLLESVKAASDIYMPVGGEISAVISNLEDAPELINEDSFEGAWIAKVKLSNPADLDKLMDAAAYETKVADED